MRSFPVRAVVRKIFLDNVILTVQADNEKDALEKAQQALEEYPGAVTLPGVPFFYVENREVEDSHVSNIEIRKDVVVADSEHTT